MNDSLLPLWTGCLEPEAGLVWKDLSELVYV